MSFHWEIDLRPAVIAVVAKREESAIDDVLDYLLETANRTIPIENHALEESGGTSRDGLNGSVFYDEIYAPKQHEEMDYRHDPGRRAKWLELTFKEEKDKCIERLARKVAF